MKGNLFSLQSKSTFMGKFNTCSNEAFENAVVTCSLNKALRFILHYHVHTHVTVVLCLIRSSMVY